MSPRPEIYLDHAATTPLDPEVLAAMRPFWEGTYGNPSSLHRWGKTARKALEAARVQVAQVLHGSPEGVTFTSGGTEANNLAILGFAHRLRADGKNHVIVSAIEHPCVLAPAQWLSQHGWDVTFLPVDAEGQVQLETLEAALRPETGLVSIMHGNNEVGTLQPIEAIGTLLRERGIVFHTDAVQTAGKLPLDVSQLPVDAVTLSSHKVYGPKGIGALYVRPDAPQPEPLIRGGGQESDRRSGTENVAGIVGFGEALTRCAQRMGEETPRLQHLQEWLIQALLTQLPTARLNGPRDVTRRVPGNVNLSLPPIGGDALVLQLDLRGIAVSSGSACHSATLEPSHVVLAMGHPREVAQSTVRFSMGRGTTQADLDHVLAVLPGIVDRLTPRQAVSPSA
jgi:cysteine desulfurase